jgi:hypothetical protein
MGGMLVTGFTRVLLEDATEHGRKRSLAAIIKPQGTRVYPQYQRGSHALESLPGAHAERWSYSASMGHSSKVCESPKVVMERETNLTSPEMAYGGRHASSSSFKPHELLGIDSRAR